jgi:lipoate-protein ligase A
MDCYRTASEELTLDADLFRAGEEGGLPESLRLWECSDPAVVVGSLGKVSDQVNEAACVADKVPIVKRVSGGGAVVVGRGCLNYSLILSLEARPHLRHVKESYQFILDRITQALGVPALDVCGTSDLAIQDRKVSGSAQRRGRRTLLHHGTILYNFDIPLLERYLRMPPREPAYRRGREHVAFVANIGLDRDVIAERLCWSWGSGADRIRTDARGTQPSNKSARLR